MLKGNRFVRGLFFVVVSALILRFGWEGLRCQRTRRTRPAGKRRLARNNSWCIIKSMSAQQVIEEFKALPSAERAQVAKFVVEHDDSWIPESFKQGMADAVAGRFVDMETVLSGAKPPSRAAE